VGAVTAIVAGSKSKSGSLSVSGSDLAPRPALDGGPAFSTPLSATRTVDLREGADFDPDPDSDLELTT